MQNSYRSTAPLHFASFRGQVQRLRETLSRKPSRERSNNALDRFMEALEELERAAALDMTVVPELLEKDPDFKTLMQFRAELVRAHHQYSKQA